MPETTIAKERLIPVRGAFYDTVETASILRVTRETLEVWRTTGRYPVLKAVRPGGKVLYSGDVILDFLNSPHEGAAPYTPKIRRPKLLPKPKRARKRRAAA
jgi:hypothetical protein